MIIISILSFANLSRLGLDAYDDRDHMKDTPAIIENWAFMFSDQRLVEVRPPVDALFVLGYLFWQNDPVGYHIMQIVLHGLATFVLVLTFRMFGADIELSLVASMLFLVNVAHFQAIHQITCITYTLSLIFSLLSVCAYKRYVIDEGGIIWQMLSILSLVLSMFSHPASAFVFLFCTFVTWHRYGLSAKTFFDLLPLGVLVILSGILASFFSLHGDQIHGVINDPQWDKVILQPFWYWGRLFTSLNWMSPVLLTDKPEAWEVIVGVFFLFTLLILCRSRIYPASYWAVWVFLSVIPFINYPSQMLGHGPSRHLYFASAGASLIFAWAIRHVIFHWFKNYYKLWGVVILCVIFTISVRDLKRAEAHTFYRSGRGYIAEGNQEFGELQLTRAVETDLQIVPKDIFKRLALARLQLGLSIRKFVQDGLEVYPDFDELYLLLGISYLQEPDSLDVNVSQKYFQRAFELTVDPENLKLNLAKLIQSLGGYYHSEGQYESAVNYYKEALKLNPDYSLAYYNLGNALNVMGRDDGALDAYQHAVSLQPDFAQALQQMANISYEKDDFKKALSIYQLLASREKNSTSYYNLGVVYQKLGDFVAAKDALEHARDMAPQDIDIMMKLAEVFYQEKEIQKAIHLYQKVVNNDPRSVLGYYNLGTLLLQERRTEEAIIIFMKAVNLYPQDSELQIALAYAYETSGRINDALDIYRNVLEYDPTNGIAQQRINLHP